MIDIVLRAGCVWVQLHCLKGVHENLSGLGSSGEDLSGLEPGGATEAVGKTALQEQVIGCNGAGTVEGDYYPEATGAAA